VELSGTECIFVAWLSVVCRGMVEFGVLCRGMVSSTTRIVRVAVMRD
jgi:hypothetical protein